MSLITVELITDADVGVLLSKDWFEWVDKSKLLTAGTHLIFRLRSKVTYKDKVNYRSVAVADNVLCIVWYHHAPSSHPPISCAEAAPLHHTCPHPNHPSRPQHHGDT